MPAARPEHTTKAPRKESLERRYMKYVRKPKGHEASLRISSAGSGGWKRKP